MVYDCKRGRAAASTATADSVEERKRRLGVKFWDFMASQR